MLVYLALHSLYVKCLNFIHKKRYMCTSHSAKGPCNKKFKPYFPTICSLQKIKGWPARLIDIYIYISRAYIYVCIYIYTFTVYIVYIYIQYTCI